MAGPSHHGFALARHGHYSPTGRWFVSTQQQVNGHNKRLLNGVPFLQSRIRGGGGGHDSNSWKDSVGIAGVMMMMASVTASGGGGGGGAISSASLSSTACEVENEDNQAQQQSVNGHTFTIHQNTTSTNIDIAENNDQQQEENTCPFPPESYNHDTYNGIQIDTSKLPHSTTTEQFNDMLQNALSQWKQQHKRGIWINIPTSLSKFVPACTNHGFDYHRAGEGMVVLKQWLPEDTESRLPHGPTHQVGIGCLILHPKKKGVMLVVQEKTGPAAARKLWKMPTGLTDPNEDIHQASIREMKEETGLDGIFDEIICFRQSHAIRNSSSSDLFFVCKMRIDANGGDEKILLKAQEEEIADIRWMTFEEYSNQGLWVSSPLYDELNRALRRVVYGDDGEDEKDGGGGGGFVAKKLPVGFRPGSNTIYVSKL